MLCNSLFIEKETSGRVRYKYCRESIIRRNSQISHGGASDIGVKSHKVERGFASCMFVEINNSSTAVKETNREM